MMRDIFFRYCWKKPQHEGVAWHTSAGFLVISHFAAPRRDSLFHADTRPLRALLHFNFARTQTAPANIE